MADIKETEWETCLVQGYKQGKFVQYIELLPCCVIWCCSCKPELVKDGFQSACIAIVCSLVA